MTDRIYPIVMLLSAAQASASAQPAPRGFDCALQGEGITRCIGRISSYPSEIALFYKAPSAHLHFHFHGNNTANLPLGSILTRHTIGRQFASSGRDLILIAPHSRGRSGNPTMDYRSHFLDADKFTAVLKELQGILTEVGLIRGTPNYGLSSHSGGYRALSAVLKVEEFARGVNEVYLLDSTYGRFDPIIRFAKRTGARLWAMYTDHLRIRTSCLMKKIGAWDFGCNPYPDTPCGTRPGRMDRECAARSGEPSGGEWDSPLGFFHTPLTHGQVVGAYLGPLLRGAR